MPYSFFHLTDPSQSYDDNPILDLPEEEFVAYHAKCKELHDLLSVTIDTYAAAHPELETMTVFMALDIHRFALKQQLLEESCDA